MTELLSGIMSAVWLGILTSISPCPLASNVAAVSFLGRSVGSPRRALLAGLFYSAGRALTYVAVGALVAGSVLSIPSVSFFLQERMNRILGPLLVAVGVGMVVWDRLPAVSWTWGTGARERMARRGILGAGALGMLFALSFCPVSAGLFFGALIPLAVSNRSPILLPAFYGLGTGLPVLIFAALLVLGLHRIGRVFGILTRIERVARPITGAIFIVAGLYVVATHWFGVSF
jgi:cytochrome c biogenesis protein CcdA